jgi:DNA repair protein RadC
MIRVYNILNNDKNQPKLNIQREIDIDEKNISIEESVEILNHFFDMRYLGVEHAYLIGYDNEMNIIGIFLVSIGTSNKCFFYKKNIATFLLLSGADRFILFHNHPNGTLDVSTDDSLSTYCIKSLAEALEVEFIDSVIISKKGWKCIERGNTYEYRKENEI